MHLVMYVTIFIFLSQYVATECNSSVHLSMVSARIFTTGAWLKELFKTNSPFDGLPIIMFGDLKQLSHIGDGILF